MISLAAWQRIRQKIRLVDRSFAVASRDRAGQVPRVSQSRELRRVGLGQLGDEGLPNLSLTEVFRGEIKHDWINPAGLHGHVDAPMRIGAAGVTAGEPLTQGDNASSAEVPIGALSDTEMTVEGDCLNEAGELIGFRVGMDTEQPVEGSLELPVIG